MAHMLRNALSFGISKHSHIYFGYIDNECVTWSDLKLIAANNYECKFCMKFAEISCRIYFLQIRNLWIEVATWIFFKEIKTTGIKRRRRRKDFKFFFQETNLLCTYNASCFSIKCSDYRQALLVCLICSILNCLIVIKNKNNLNKDKK